MNIRDVRENDVDALIVQVLLKACGTKDRGEI